MSPPAHDRGETAVNRLDSEEPWWRVASGRWTRDRPEIVAGTERLLPVQRKGHATGTNGKPVEGFEPSAYSLRRNRSSQSELHRRSST